MRRFLLCPLFILILQTSIFAQSRVAISDDVQQVLFLGNSITYSGQYIAYVETIYRLNHPEKRLDWINLGLPSETVSGLSEEGHAGGAFPRPDLHERLDRVFSALKPNLVFINYGMNDGIYLPFDSARFKKYEAGMNWLNSKVLEIGAEAIFLTPPIYDPAKGIAYSLTLDRYSEWLINQENTANWKVIDLHFPMRNYLETKREIDPDFYLAKDGVHPDSIGHWLMARSILEYLGIKDVADAESFTNAIAYSQNGQELFILIFQKQKILRDAYLSATGHLRPGLPEGLSLLEAKKQALALENQILDLLVRHK
jgi:lysophospholipase L1-like esterase